ncbi:MAG: hypothetical protein R3234_07795 [Thermoanaerobaculia bacterium]|nr:hypothetical protein [Thermoanaerobaculia bacterium]
MNELLEEVACRMVEERTQFLRGLSLEKSFRAVLDRDPERPREPRV